MSAQAPENVLRGLFTVRIRRILTESRREIDCLRSTPKENWGRESTVLHMEPEQET